MRAGLTIIAMLLSIGLSPRSYSQALQCTDIARTLKEFSISTSSTSYLNSVYDNYCEASGAAKQVSGGVGFDAVVKAIPIKFTGSYSSNEEAMRNFCKTYAGTTSQQERKYSYEERVAGKALDTVSDCLRLQAEGVTITHDIVNRESMGFFLKSAIDKKITLNGVTTTGPITCTGLIKGKRLPVNSDTGLSISTSQTFTCQRTAATSPATKVATYPEATIIVETNLGNYNVLWPRDERLPEDMASAVGRELEGLKGTVGVLTQQANQRLSSLEREPKFGGLFQKVDPGFPKHNEFVNPVSNTFGCPVGYSEKRYARVRLAEPEVGADQFLCVKD